MDQAELGRVMADAFCSNAQPIRNFAFQVEDVANALRVMGIPEDEISQKINDAVNKEFSELQWGF